MKVIFMPWGRVGSNLIIGILEQYLKVHSALIDAGAIKKYVTMNEPLTGIAGELRQSPPEVVLEHHRSWLSEVMSKEDENLEHIVNVSMTSIKYSEVQLADLLKPHITSTIYLDRKNVSRTALSVVKARAYAEAHKEKFGKPSWGVRPGRVLKSATKVDPNEFLGCIQLIETNKQKQDRLQKLMPGRRIFYEDIEIDLHSVMLEVWRTFGIDYYEYRIPFVKAVGKDLRAEISNYDELMDSLPDKYREQLQSG